jgi:hypothetical protein
LTSRRNGKSRENTANPALRLALALRARRAAAARLATVGSNLSHPYISRMPISWPPIFSIRRLADGRGLLISDFAKDSSRGAPRNSFLLAHPFTRPCRSLAGSKTQTPPARCQKRSSLDRLSRSTRPTSNSKNPCAAATRPTRPTSPMVSKTLYGTGLSPHPARRAVCAYRDSENRGPIGLVGLVTS